jgi:oxygen-independent coproporphyrinogen-3 oxidase
MNNMMDYVQQSMTENGYLPYYMYRQKMMLGNLENVGYCKPAKECIYNIQMIEERETIIGFGADAVTKLVFMDENRIERLANKKDIKEYINTIDINIEKKLQFLKMLT